MLKQSGVVDAHAWLLLAVNMRDVPPRHALVLAVCHVQMRAAYLAKLIAMVVWANKQNTRRMQHPS